MLFFDDRKKTASTLLARRKSNGERVSDPTPMKPEVTKTESGEIDGRHVAIQEMLSGIHEKSAQKTMEALGHFLEMNSGAPKPPKE